MIRCFALALAGCATQASDHPLLSATRVSLVERATANVDVDVATSGDFDVSAPPTVAVTKSVDPARPGLSVTPSCGASNGPDVTFDVVVTAQDGRSATLLVDVADDRTLGCFRHVDVQVGFAASQIACADLVGDGGLEVVIDGTLLAHITSFDSTTPPAITPLTGYFLQTFAMMTTQGLDIIGVSAPGATLWHLVGTSWQPFVGGPKVGNGVVGLRSPNSAKDPDFLVGWDGATSPDGLFIPLSPGPPSSKLPLLLTGVGFAIGTYAGGQKLAGAQLGGASQQANQAMPLVLTWGPAGDVVAVGLDPDPRNRVNLDVPAVVNQGIPTASIAPRTGPNGDDLLVGIQSGGSTSPFDNAVDELGFTPNLQLQQAYGGVRNIAPTPDGGVLLGADRGAVLTRYLGSPPAPVYQLIDIAEDEPDVIPSRDYATAIAPCLDHNGGFAGFAMTVDGAHVRVAGPPDLP